MEARNRFLPDWMTRIRTRQIVLPRFQRMEAWGYKEVTDLLQTVLNGLPAGSVLILEVGDKIPFISRPMQGAPKDGDRITELLLDGQQRLTALWRALTDNYPERTYFVKVPEDGLTPTEVEVYPVSRWERKGKRFPLWADTPRECWERRLLPIRLLPPGETDEIVDAWVEQAVEADPQKEKNLNKIITKLRQQVASFNLPFLSLPVGTPREVALDVFVKMNIRSVRLTAFDIIVAQTEEETGQSLHDLVESLTSTVPGLPAYDTPEDTVLNAMALLQDRVPNQAGYFGLDLSRMVTDWPKLVTVAKQAVEFLEQESVFDSTRLPTETVLAPLIALWTYVPEKPDAQGNARILLRKYLWRAFFTDRYERAAATAALQDFRAFRNVITGKGAEESVPIFDESNHPLPTIEELIQAGWPKNRDRLARAILLVSLRGGAHDIADDSIVTRGNLGQREYHHLYPVAFLRTKAIPDEDAYRALNCALISWKTNRVISAKEPLKYLEERAEANSLGAKEIARRLATHVISYEGLEQGNYQKFLEDRGIIIQAAMQNLSAGEYWKPRLPE